MTKQDSKNIIDELSAEKQFARNRVDEAMEVKNIIDEDIWETIGMAYTDLIFKLERKLSEIA